MFRYMRARSLICFDISFRFADEVHEAIPEVDHKGRIQRYTSPVAWRADAALRLKFITRCLRNQNHVSSVGNFMGCFCTFLSDPAPILSRMAKRMLRQCFHRQVYGAEHFMGYIIRDDKHAKLEYCRESLGTNNVEHAGAGLVYLQGRCNILFSRVIYKVNSLNTNKWRMFPHELRWYHLK